MWLSGNSWPDFRTLNRIRGDELFDILLLRAMTASPLCEVFCCNPANYCLFFSSLAFSRPTRYNRT
jgi:hypothetical protein